MTDLSVTACSRCREQKLRCSREKPDCGRCVRAGIPCVYPQPPDRKTLAAFRRNSRKRPADESDHSPGTQSNSTASHHRRAPTYSVSSTSPPEDGSSRNGEVSLSRTVSGSAIPKETLRLLVHTYFSCIFNATLNFHRPSFEKAFNEDSLPQHTLLAVSAFAAKQYASEIHAMGGFDKLKTLGRQWALEAGTTILQTIDQPKIQDIQTCQTLALYWFSQGDSQRNALFSGIAYRVLRHRLVNKQNNASTEGWLEAEVERRCFWAAWVMNCINADHYLLGSSADKLALSLPLPVAEASFYHEIQESGPTLHAALDSLGTPPVDSAASPSPSIKAEMLKIVMHWLVNDALVARYETREKRLTIDRAMVRDYVETKNTRSSSENLTRTFALDEGLTKWAAGLHPSLTYSRRNLYDQLEIRQQPSYNITHATHRQCRLVLYSSFVPQFSGMALTDVKPPEVVNMSAQIALNSAKALSEMGADLLAIDWDPTRIAAFFGYCMYAAASIHMTLIFSHDGRVAAEARKNLTSSLRILKAMKPYWKNLEILWTRVCLLYEVQKARLNEDTGTDAGDDPHKLDRVAAIKRDTGRLTEPLKDSVLQYTLGKLRQEINVDERSPVSFELEEVINAEQYSSTPLSGNSNNSAAPTPLLSRREALSTHVAPPPSAPPTTQFDQSYAPVNSNVTAEMNTQLNSWNLFGAGMNTAQWEPDLGTLPRGWLSYDDMLAYAQQNTEVTNIPFSWERGAG